MPTPESQPSSLPIVHIDIRVAPRVDRRVDPSSGAAEAHRQRARAAAYDAIVAASHVTLETWPGVLQVLLWRAATCGAQEHDSRLMPWAPDSPLLPMADAVTAVIERDHVPADSGVYYLSPWYLRLLGDFGAYLQGR